MEEIKAKTTKEKVEKKVEQKLNPAVWEVPYNADLVAQVIYVYNSNERKSTANVKSRGDVSGGGKKPWKQKGTGRARAGSSRSPLWVGGGVTFATVGDRNWNRKINKKMTKKATCIMLSERLRKNNLDFVTFGDEPKEMRKSIENKSVLVVTNNENVKKTLRNMKVVSVVSADKVNAKHIASKKNILVDNESINVLETRLTNGK